MIVWKIPVGRTREEKKRVFTERSRSDSDPHRGFDSPFLMSASFLRGPQIVRYRLCNSQRRVIDGNWKDGAAANGKDDFLPGQVNLKTPRGASLPRHAIPHLDGYFVTSSGNCQSGNATRTNKINSHIGTFRHHLKSAPSWNYHQARWSNCLKIGERRNREDSNFTTFVRAYLGGQNETGRSNSNAVTVYWGYRVNRSRLKQYPRAIERGTRVPSSNARIQGLPIICSLFYSYITNHDTLGSIGLAPFHSLALVPPISDPRLEWSSASRERGVTLHNVFRTVEWGQRKS